LFICFYYYYAPEEIRGCEGRRELIDFYMEKNRQKSEILYTPVSFVDVQSSAISIAGKIIKDT